MAIVDLSGSRSRFASYSQFLLLATAESWCATPAASSPCSGIRTWERSVSMDGQGKRANRLLAEDSSGELSGSRVAASFSIYRSDGALFLSLTDQVEDSVKRTLYNFFLGKKAQA